MAIDTLEKRRRALFIDPLSNGSIDAIDRSQVSKMFYVGFTPSNNRSLQKDDLITVCGRRQPILFGVDRFIDLFKFVPDYNKTTGSAVFVQELQDYLNSMYEGNNRLTYTEETP